MTTPALTTPLIVETRRGPCIAGTRITVFSVMDYLQGAVEQRCRQASHGHF